MEPRERREPERSRPGDGSSAETVVCPFCRDDLLLLGAAPASLVAFGVVATIGGLWLWSGIGPGLAAQARPRVVAALVAVTAALAGLELALSG